MPVKLKRTPVSPRPAPTEIEATPDGLGALPGLEGPRRDPGPRGLSHFDRSLRGAEPTRALAVAPVASNLGPGAPRRAGVLMPIFSLRSKNDFGVGDFGSLKAFFPAMQAARQTMLLTLPLLPTPADDSSPYSSRCAFGLNPLYVDLSALPEFKAIGAMTSLTEAERAQLAQAKAAPSVQYPVVQPLKQGLMRRAFEQFYKADFKTDSPRAQALTAFVQRHSYWVKDHALFEAIAGEQKQKYWKEWPPELRDRDPKALAKAEHRLEKEVTFHLWSQFVADEQWSEVRGEAKAHGVLLAGDEPFSINKQSSDAWAHPDVISTEGSLGVPPDQFSSKGQVWGLPHFDFAAMAKDDYRWLRERGNAAASYYDLRRIDHAIGYAHQYVWNDAETSGAFVPPDTATQMKLARTLLQIVSAHDIITEDLGVVPPFLSDLLDEMKLTRYKVLRYEETPDGGFKDPAQFRRESIVVSGTHDTSTAREWWEKEATPKQRRAARDDYGTFADLEKVPAAFTDRVRDDLIKAAHSAPSQLAIIPWQDVVGSDVRTNSPGTVGPLNWSYRMPELVEDLLDAGSPTRKELQHLASETAASGRLGNQINFT